ncbi:MAG: NlpC/P60 family protein [Candidatus Acidiferrales bacterium]
MNVSPLILRTDEQQARADIVREAYEWIGTPYHIRGRLKGIGVDCLTFIVGVFERTGVIKPITDPIPYYPPQLHFHQETDITERAVLLYLREVPKPPERIPLPGDVILFKVGKALAHCALVINFPEGIHASDRGGVQLDDYERIPAQHKRECKVFSAWG